MMNNTPYGIFITWSEEKQQYHARSGDVHVYHRSFETARKELIRQLEGVHGQDKKG